MLRRRFAPSASSPSTVTMTMVNAARHASVPGWQTSTSTRDARSREQRDADRRLRQLEKLPRPEVLHDFQYPFEKTVLCDTWFQPPVYATELDTPQLFNPYPPSDFFVYFNAADFERSCYPAVPEKDLRLFGRGSVGAPGGGAAEEEELQKDWQGHRKVSDQFLRKHEIVPEIIPFVDYSVNMSVVFGEPTTSAEESDGGARALNMKNFWKTSLLGNYMELKESHLYGPPSIFLRNASSSSAKTGEEDLYTLLIVTPDYPCRAEPSTDNFFLHYAVANLKCGDGQQPEQGTVVVPYIPPLPTEDAGASRILCVLFKQEGGAKYASPRSSSSSSKSNDSSSNNTSGGEEDCLFEERHGFRLHDERRALRASKRGQDTQAGGGSDVMMVDMVQLESLLSPHASAVTFFQTTWDIQVQEWYEGAGLPEPRYYPHDLVELTAYNALPLDHHHVKSRHAATGAVNDETVMFEKEPLLDRQSTALGYMSASTKLSKDRKYMTRPKSRS